MRYFIYTRKSTESEERQALSIESQKAELARAFTVRPDIEIVGAFEESKSAKAPGRPVFEEMLARIEQGEAEGIIAWHPDRLARNSIDGGRIIYLLDTKVLKDLQFATFSFENNPQGKLMLSVLLGFSKYYVDALSENILRGNRAKVAQGWRPNLAPVGYLNDKATRTIVPDPERFPLVRRLFDLALTGNYSLAALQEEGVRMGLRTVKRRHIGGKPLSVAGVHRVLTDPFYAGILRWGGKDHQGAHKAMISLDEYDRVQRHLRRPGKAAPTRHTFPYTGLIRCGECGYSVTAEHKTNRFGSRYTYYHCTKRRPRNKCPQRSVSADALDRQIRGFIGSLRIAPSLHAWAIAEVRKRRTANLASFDERINALNRALDDMLRARGNLTGLRIREQITEEEFSQERQKLDGEAIRLRQAIDAARSAEMWFEPAEALVSFASRALDWYDQGDDDVRRQIVRATGSNPVLLNKILSVKAKKPLTQFVGVADSFQLRRALEVVRTLWEAQDPEILALVHDVRELMKLVEEPREAAPREAAARAARTARRCSAPSRARRRS